MTTLTEKPSKVQNLSRWQRFQAWLSNVTNAIDYDPQTHANATIKNLKNEVERLANRVNVLEQNGNEDEFRAA